nr:MAG TPA: hypothetical protein [Caudoviricetes sp.]
MAVRREVNAVTAVVKNTSNINPNAIIAEPNALRITISSTIFATK